MMYSPLTSEQIASLTPEQRQDYNAQPVYMQPLAGRQILEWNAEQRRLRQIERNRRLHRGEMTRAEFDAASKADPQPPLAGEGGADHEMPAP
jgi:hypothetical protein